MPFIHIIFQCQLNDKFLNEEFLTLLMPMINKSNNFILSTENKGELNEHYHILFEYECSTSDRSRVVQKFKTKPFQRWYKKIKDDGLSTIIDPKFETHALKIVAVNETDEDKQYVIGYVLKEDTNPKIKGFTEEQLLQGIKYYKLENRIKAKEDVNYGWRYIQPKTSHGIITRWCQENKVSFVDFKFSMLASEKISSVQMTHNQQNKVISELILSENVDNSTFDMNVNKWEIDGSQDGVNCVVMNYKTENKLLNEQVEKLQQQIENLKIQLNNK